jgi:hypothetical protein
MLTDIDDVLNQNISENNVNNYLAGVFVRLDAGKFYAQPEFYFNSKGGTIDNYDLNLLSIATSTVFDYQSIDVPILFGFKVVDRCLMNLRIHTGPVFSFITTKSFTTELENLNVDELKDQYAGWQFGVGFDFWMITIDANIENSFNILDSSSEYQAKNKVYLVTAGIKIF